MIAHIIGYPTIVTSFLSDLPLLNYFDLNVWKNWNLRSPAVTHPNADRARRCLTKWQKYSPPIFLPVLRFRATRNEKKHISVFSGTQGFRICAQMTKLIILLLGKFFSQVCWSVLYVCFTKILFARFRSHFAFDLAKNLSFHLYLHVLGRYLFWSKSDQKWRLCRPFCFTKNTKKITKITFLGQNQPNFLLFIQPPIVSTLAKFRFDNFQNGGFIGHFVCLPPISTKSRFLSYRRHFIRCDFRSFCVGYHKNYKLFGNIFFHFRSKMAAVADLREKKIAPESHFERWVRRPWNFAYWSS